MKIPGIIISVMLFLYKMFDNDLIGTYGYQLWFISTIIQFYLLFPLIRPVKGTDSGESFLLAGLLISWAWATCNPVIT